MQRIDGLRAIAPLMEGAVVVTTAGGATREWWAIGDNRAQLQVKTLGLGSSIALGIAVNLPSRIVVVLDGDGALLMNLQSLVTCAVQHPANLVHICFDNGIYESSGGTPTLTARGVDLGAIAQAAGTTRVYSVASVTELVEAWGEYRADPAHSFMHVRVEPGVADVPRIAVDEVENKYRLVRYLEEGEGISAIAKPASLH